jgi:hypothetical protein
MATLENAVPRKRLATYGKAARRRIPDFTLTRSHEIKPEVKQSEQLLSRSPSVSAALVPRKEKSVIQGTVSRTASLISSSAAADVFDISSGDDDASVPAKPACKAAKTKKCIPQVGKDVLTAQKEDPEMRKRVKLSSIRPLVQKAAPAQAPGKALSPKTKTHKASTFTARPKPGVYKKAIQPRPPRKVSPAQPSLPVSGTPSPQRSHADPPSAYISPRGLQMWKNILEPIEADENIGEHTVGDRTRVTNLGSPLPDKSLFKPAGISKHRSPRKLPRRRLIDSLVEQAGQVDDMEEDDLETENSSIPAGTAPVPNFSNPASRSQSTAPEEYDRSASQSQSQSQSQVSQTIGPRFTYSKQRSMLAEEDFLKQLELDMSSQPVQPTLGKKPRRGSIPNLPKLQSFHEDGEEESVVAIRNVHELRQAGANSRFMDEIEDLLDRIGSPTTASTSMRRSGLLDIASKIKDKSFTRQFHSHGVEQRLFLHMGRETDIIAGFIMISTLMALLAEANIIPHFVTQLRTQGIARLLIRLLEFPTSISLLAKARTSNLSKVAQSLLSEHSDYLLNLPIWEEMQPKMQPKTISPRTVALKCLELIVRQTREAGISGDLFSKELTTNLFWILKSASDESAWEMPSGREAVDFGLALSALESHSIAARTLQDESVWLVDYLPIIADTLETALAQPIDKFGDLQFLILRLTLNVTNNNEKASDVFARKSLMAIMGQVIVSMFKRISGFLTEDDFSVAVEQLIILLGAMANFAECSSAARDSFQSLEDSPRDSLHHMVQLLIENQEMTFMVSLQRSRSYLDDPNNP